MKSIVTAPHNLSADDCLSALKTSTQGPAHAEAIRRLAEYGPNRLPNARSRGPIYRFLCWFALKTDPGRCGVNLAHLGNDGGLWPPKMLTQEQAVEIKVMARRASVFGRWPDISATHATRSGDTCVRPMPSTTRGGSRAQPSWIRTKTIFMAASTRRRHPGSQRPCCCARYRNWATPVA